MTFFHWIHSQWNRKIAVRSTLLFWLLICISIKNYHCMTHHAGLQSRSLSVAVGFLTAALFAISIVKFITVQSSLQPTKTHSPGVVLCEGQWMGLGPTSVLTLVVIRLIAPTYASFANINKKTSHPGTVWHTWHPRVLIIVRREALWCWTGVKPFAQ